MDFHDKTISGHKHKVRITELEKKIQVCGLKMTPLRRIILCILIEAKDHLNVGQIYSLATRGNKFFALASVYRNINLMVEIGIITSHQFKSREGYYELADTTPHDHLIDLDSGQVIEFRNAALDRLKKEIAKEYGYLVDDCHVELYARPVNRPLDVVAHSQLRSE